MTSEELTSIKQTAADMEVVANFLGMKGRFESDMLRISISDLANAIHKNTSAALLEPQAIRADNPQALSVDELSDDQMQAIADAKHPAIEALDCLDNFVRNIAPPDDVCDAFETIRNYIEGTK